MGGGGLIGLNQPAIEVVKHAFGDDPHNIFATNLAAALPRGRYDFIANLPSQSKDYEALQQMLEEKWGVIGRRETLNEDVMRLVVKSPSNLRLKADTSQGSYHMLWKDSAGRLDCGYSTLPDFANFIGLISQFLIVDDTGLSGHYDFDLACSPQMIKSRDWKSLNQGLDPLGLELVPANVPVEMRVVEKIN